MFEIVKFQPSGLPATIADPRLLLAIRIMRLIRTGSRQVGTLKTSVGLVDIHGKKVFAVSTAQADLLYTGPSAAALAFVDLVGVDKARAALIAEEAKN